MEKSSIQAIKAKEENTYEETKVNDIKPQKRKSKKIYKIFREIIAILFWTYVIVKVFIFDIDVFLVSKILPNYVGSLNFKFFLIICMLALIWIFTKNKQFFLRLMYIVFYPLIILLWKIPRSVFKRKSWILAFAIINSIISFFKSIKFNFIISAFYLLSVVIIFSFSNEYFLWSCIIVILMTVFIIYINRFILIFKPSSEFKLYEKLFFKIRASGISSFSLDDSMKSLPVESLDQNQIEKWTTNLQMSVLYNRICLFVARKLKEYQKSGFNFVYYVLSILMLIVLTTFSFAAINMALYKINADLFGYSVAPTFFTFFYYSFNVLLNNSIQELVPALPLSQTAYMIESMFVLFLVIIFVSLLFSVKSQKHIDELDRIIEVIEQQGREMESFIKQEYKINSIEDAIVELEKLKAGLIEFIYKISKSIN